MPKPFNLVVLSAAIIFVGCGDQQTNRTYSSLPQKIAFGSCMHQDKPKPVLDLAIAADPDLFIFLGDNIYGDTEDMEVLRGKYAQLATAPEFVRLKAAVPLIATWDDHDFGENDAGHDYPFKASSAEIFLDFWDEPLDSPRRDQEGIYTSYFYEEHGRRLQIIMLDMRTFRDRVLPFPSNDPTLAMLGETQWDWLESQLRLDADIRLIGSSTQFSHTPNNYESWTNMTVEHDRLVQLIQDTGADGVIVLSGDVHWGELSRLDSEAGYPIWDLTSSGITQTWDSISPNDNRVGNAVAENNFGLVSINWNQKDPSIQLELIDQNNQTRVSQQIRLSEISN